jgi:signal peptidase I
MRKDTIKTIARYVIFTVAIILLFKFVLMLNIIPSGSMENTIMTGDIVIGTRLDAQTVERYDIMVFTPVDTDSDKEYLIKRVIGLPGETIEVKEGKVYADGVELDSSFIKAPMNMNGDGVYVVPEGCYFMMGDNRNNSYDSRFWDEEDKYIPLDHMVAKARFVIYPFNQIQSLAYKEAEE